MKRIIFITWAQEGTYGRMLRSLLLASALRREAEVGFAVKCRGKTLAYLIDSGFPYFFLEDGIPGADLYIVDLPSWEGSLPGKAIFFDTEGKNGIKTLPLPEGGKFQVLSPRYRHFHLLEKEIRPKGKKVLVSLSTRADTEEVERAIRAVLDEGLFPILAPHPQTPKPWLSSLRRKYEKLKLLGPVNDLSRAMWKADMVLISGFIKPFEAASVGAPAVYWEEEPASREFQAQGAGKIYTPGILTRLYESPEEREEISRMAKSLVDGLGFYRVLQRIKGEV